jgi:branched-chain amino acid transport system substrate-binding protein
MKYIYLSILAVLLALYGCLLPEDPAKQRAEEADEVKGDILVGAVAPWSGIDTMLWEGIAMAADEINEAGGLLGRKIKLIKRDDESSVEKGVLIAQEFGENPDIVAVVGHYESFITIPASVVYQYYGILMLSTVDTDPDLTDQGFPLVFRTTPDDTVYGNRLANFCLEKNYDRFVLYLHRDQYGRDFSDAFASAAQKAGITIVDSEAYDSTTGTANFRNVLRRWKNHYSFDAILLSGELPQAAAIIMEARRIGLEEPIFGGIALDRKELLTMLGKDIKDVFLPTNFNPYSNRPEVRKFVRKFRERHGKMPDILAAQGYDTIRTLAYAIDHSKSTSPPQMADALRGAQDLKGVTGAIRFSREGSRILNHIYGKVVENGQFKYLNQASDESGKH